eukprot:12665224-Alexandrium_andersonii.AAC.1
MSASLVGSEMCIRDRLLVLARSPCPGRCLPRAQPVLPLLQLPTVPVAYTHLTLPTICSV